MASRSPFDPWRDGTAKTFVDLDLWGQRRHIYANANLSIYSGQACNGGCGFCVEKLRPAARGVELASQKTVEADDARYFLPLAEVLDALRPLDPSVSLTGGEPSLDPRLPRLLRTLQDRRMRKRTMTTNGSGLLDVREKRAVVDWVTATGVRHLNLSRAHVADADNARLMQLDGAPNRAALAEIVARTVRGGTRPRLSCVLLRDGIADLDGILGYLAFAESLGVDNVVFRQLMDTGDRGQGTGDSALSRARDSTQETGDREQGTGDSPPTQAGTSQSAPGNGLTKWDECSSRTTLPGPPDGRGVACPPSPVPCPSGGRGVVAYSDAQRVALGPLLAQLRGRRDFTFQRRVRGYYYEVEVWRWRGIDVVLEEASLTWLAESRQRWPDLVFELVFHPNAVLCSTWQPWDGVLGPPSTRPGDRGQGTGDSAPVLAKADPSASRASGRDPEGQTPSACPSCLSPVPSPLSPRARAGRGWT